MAAMQVKIKYTQTEEGFEGTASVRNYEVFDFGNTLEELKDNLIEHLLDEEEIKPDNYEIEIIEE